MPKTPLVIVLSSHKAPDLLTTMCFCKIERLYHNEEFAIPNRPRQQASQRLSPSSRLGIGHNISVLPPGLQPISAVESYSHPRIVALRRSVSQDRFVLVQTITPRSNVHKVRQRPSWVSERALPKDLRRGIQPSTTAEARPASSVPSSFMPKVFVNRTACPLSSSPEQSGIMVHPLIRKRKTVGCKLSCPITTSHQRLIC